MLRNSRPEFRLLPLSQRYALQISSRSRPAAVPEERIAKHLSERALTAGGYHGYGYDVSGD